MELKIDTGLIPDRTTLLPVADRFSYHFVIAAGGKVFMCMSTMGNEVAMNRSLQKVQADLESGTVNVHPVHIPIDKK